MSGKPPDPKQRPPAPPKQKTGVRPAVAPKPGPTAPRPRPSDPGSTLSDFEENTVNTRAPTLGEIRRITGSIPTGRTTSPLVPQPAATAPPPQPREQPSQVLTARPNVLQRQLHHSGFDDEERTETSAILGHAPRLTLDEDEEEDSSVGMAFDGVHPAPGVAAIDTWKATIPPAQSMFGRRSKRGYLNVIAQFAAGHNPRYAPDAKGQPRSHVFVWDVSRAMGCEIPHFLGGRELSLAQTVDWMKLSSQQRGWRKVKLETALQQVELGNLAIMVPRDPKKKLIAVLRPREGHAELRVAAAVPETGNDMPALDVMGTNDVELYVHD